MYLILQGKLSESWATNTKAAIAEAILNMTKLEERHRDPQTCVKTPTVSSLANGINHFFILLLQQLMLFSLHLFWHSSRQDGALGVFTDSSRILPCRVAPVDQIFINV